MRFLLLGGVVIAMALAACGGSVNQDPSGSGASGAGGHASTSGAGASGTHPHGDCATDADCGGHPCVPLTPGGYKVCTSSPPQATKCSMPPGPPDQCCTSSDCKGNNAGCYSTMNLPSCGGAMALYNECLQDTCQSDNDCVKSSAPAICAPAGAFGEPKRGCFTAFCRTDADCTAKAGGACLTIANPCCSIPDGLGCVYPGGCAKDSDCPQGGPHQTCKLDPMTGQGTCAPGFSPCPA